MDQMFHFTLSFSASFSRAVPSLISCWLCPKSMAAERLNRLGRRLDKLCHLPDDVKNGIRALDVY